MELEWVVGQDREHRYPAGFAAWRMGIPQCRVYRKLDKPSQRMLETLSALSGAIV